MNKILNIILINGRNDQERDLVLITHQEDSIMDSNDHSTNETPTNEDTATETNPTYPPPSSAQFRIPFQTNKE